MKKILAVIAPTLCLAALSLTASADTLKLVSAPTGSTGPYQLSLDGGAAVSMFCLDDFLTNQVGEQWNVNVVSGASLGTQGFSNSVVKQYDEEAYIYSLLGSTVSISQYGHTHSYTVDNDDVQEALWKIFDSSENIHNNDVAEQLVADALSANISASVIDAATFYIPTGTGITGGGWNPGMPQTFIGTTPPPSAVPEPSSLIMMGSGLMGLAGMVRRRLARA